MTDDTERWLQFIAAVNYLAELERPGFTIADAIEDALRAWTDCYLEPQGSDDLQPFEPPWNDPDPLRSTIERVLQAVPPAGGIDGVALTEVLIAAIEQWTRVWSNGVNEGRSFNPSRCRCSARSGSTLECLELSTRASADPRPNHVPSAR